MIHRFATCGLVFAALAFSSASSAQAQSVVARFDCRSFGQTASSGGTLNIKYATPVMCWATTSTVSGVAVNDAGWVPEVFFDWDWSDGSLGSVTRGGISMDLGKSVGVVAAHAFRPTTFNASCGGGTNSLHVVRLTVSAVVGGQRVNNAATLNVCVENPRTTWPNPIAFCDDSNCADDPGVPPGTVHGGNLTDLAAILNNCDLTSNRIVLEGGVTFSTASTNISVGAKSCLVESYGGTKAKLLFTSTSTSSRAIAVNDPACAGYRFHNLTFAGSGTGPRLIGGGLNTGCYLLLDADASATPGEEFASLSTVDTGPGTMSEGYYFLSDYTTHFGGNNSVFIYGSYIAFVGGEIGATGEHIIRLPQWDHIVIDAMYLHDQQPAKHVLALRQDCGGSSSCPNNASASVLAVTRNSIVAAAAGAIPVQFCAPGSGSAEPTKCYDTDWVRNLTAFRAATGNDWFYEFPNTTAGHEVKRVRFIQNAADMTGIASTTGNANQMAMLPSTVLDVAWLGNDIFYQGASGRSYGFTTNPNVDVAKNNVCYEDGSATCDPFSGLSSGNGNEALSTDPFDSQAGPPKTYAAFQFPQLSITNSSPLASSGVLDAVPTDVLGNARNVSVGVYGIGTGAPPPPPPPPPGSAPAAPILL